MRPEPQQRAVEPMRNDTCMMVTGISYVAPVAFCLKHMKAGRGKSGVKYTTELTAKGINLAVWLHRTSFKFVIFRSP
jgi:hypothetical protein